MAINFIYERSAIRSPLTSFLNFIIINLISEERYAKFNLTILVGSLRDFC